MSHSSQWPSDPAYYIEDCRIFGPLHLNGPVFVQSEVISFDYCKTRNISFLNCYFVFLSAKLCILIGWTYEKPILRIENLGVAFVGLYQG